MLEFARKLYKDNENEVLIEMAQQLAYKEKTVEQLKQDVLSDKEHPEYTEELYQEEVVDLVIHMANDYINQNRPQDTSPLQDKRDYFNDNYINISKDYFQDRLPDIKYKETTARSVHELEAQNIYKMSILGPVEMNKLIEKEPDIEMNVYRKIREEMYDNSCNSWCETCESFTKKAKEYGIEGNIVPIRKTVDGTIERNII